MHMFNQYEQSMIELENLYNPLDIEWLYHIINLKAKHFRHQSYNNKTNQSMLQFFEAGKPKRSYKLCMGITQLLSRIDMVLYHPHSQHSELSDGVACPTGTTFQ